MKSDDRIGRKLAEASAVPPAVRARMARDPAGIAPGAVSALQRFYTALRAQGRDFDCPPRACYDAAAQSEATLGTLLRALDRYAPELNLAEGRAARSAWYKRRGRQAKRELGRDPKPRSAAARPCQPARPPAVWPVAWHPAFARLHAESPRETTARRHVASLNRCAEELARRGIAPVLDRFRTLLLGVAFSEQDLSPRTVRNYLGAFVRLAQCLDVDEETLAGMRDAQAVWKARGARATKRRELVLEEFAEAGGSWRGSIDTAMELLRSCEDETGSWRADAELRRLQAAVSLLALNTCARTGDIASWRLGRHLRRRADGRWRLRYLSGKNRKKMLFSRLWPETDAALDAVLLGGRPARMLGTRYQMLDGLSWMRHGEEEVPAKYPSTLVKSLLSVSAHPLRTLAADVLRQLDPGESPRKAAVWLGHHDPRSQEEYTVAAQGRAASIAWSEARARHRSGCAVSRQGPVPVKGAP